MVLQTKVSKITTDFSELPFNMGDLLNLVLLPAGITLCSGPAPLLPLPQPRVGGLGPPLKSYSAVLSVGSWATSRLGNRPSRFCSLIHFVPLAQLSPTLRPGICPYVV